MGESQEVGAASTLGLAFLGLRVFSALITRLITSPFYGSKGGKTYFRDVMYTVTRVSTRNASIAQHRYLQETTTIQYAKACKDLGREPQTFELPSGVKVHWIGKPTAKKIIVYYHGGGYTVPINAGGIRYLFNVVQDASPNGDELAMLLPAYDLAPEATYPSQLRQAVEVLSYAINTLNYKPSQILLAGDSAGGNLTLAVMSHILHPHPDIPALQLSQPFNAAILISPWVSFRTDQPAFKRNANSDVLDAKMLNFFSKTFIGGLRQTDAFVEPLKGDESWWTGLEKYVPTILIWGGEAEVMIDSITEFAAKLERSYRGKLTYWIQGRAIHEEMLIDSMLGYKESGESGRVLQNWIKSKL